MVAEPEMLEDIRDYDDARQRLAAGEEVVPSQVVYAILDGENPLRVWREHRHLTQQELADRAGISKPYLSQLEAGKRTGTTDVLARLAETLNLTIDDIVR
ncbi:MAG: helix-turn-helix transcriptional regulator [Caldilinea sp.]|nr:helix-turn-helix transcriptional regulator [Caldilinea sp.]MCB0042829.1 helix-turn-helix transcriptional regulator [Caldilinea sp.]MCB0049146.1 helix-turn-helix transcriptional regulator [Caldilinea sp.]MCB0067310.1 helix-turn-helix transcriptional regulator [Caldilineaceae bacterium]MCB0135488.1 helix-turn-helix transcriptional regulator [Caldilineaceae bacterium]